MNGAPPSTPSVAVDNDIVLKAACYGASSTLWPPSSVAERMGVLGQAPFVVSKRIARMGLVGSADDALSDLQAILDRAIVLEPTDEELRVAAEVEAVAATGGHQLDPGESQLAAIVAGREITGLETGDKRGIRGLEAVLDHVGAVAHLVGRVRCLEQLIHEAVENGAMLQLRAAICRERAVDTALTMCFACHSPAPTADDVLAGLRSYISDLRQDAQRVLMA